MKGFLKQLDDALNNKDSELFLPTQTFLSIVVVLSILSIVFETVQSLGDYMPFFVALEWFAAIVFAIEYLIRVITTEKKLKYIFSFLGLVDLVSILPTFLSISNMTALKSIRTIRILRLLRIMRISKISRSYLKTHNKSKTKSDFIKLNITIYVIALISAIITLGSIFYLLESDQDAYSNIPLAMLQVSKIFFGSINVAPVVTIPGQILTVITGFLSLALFGFMINIVGEILQNVLLGEKLDDQDPLS